MSALRNALKRISPLRRIVLRFRNGTPYVKSYSQLGEDVIVRYIFRKLGITHPTYIDIGANDPECFNNTALFYSEGSRGINIEPDTKVFKELKFKRKHDTNLNIGVANTDGEADFYVLSDDKMSTFSKEEAEAVVKKSPALSFHITKMPTLTLDTVIAQYAGGVFPDFLSLDVEGLDRMVLESINYEKTAPKIICVETIRDPQGIEDFLASKGYIKLSSTFLNGIFCKKELWENR